jgi:hypothetical protein
MEEAAARTATDSNSAVQAKLTIVGDHEKRSDIDSTDIEYSTGEVTIEVPHLVLNQADSTGFDYMKQTSREFERTQLVGGFGLSKRTTMLVVFLVFAGISICGGAIYRWADEGIDTKVIMLFGISLIMLVPGV